MQTDYILGNKLAFAAQLLTFSNNIGPYVATLGLNAAEVTAQADDAKYYNYIVTSWATMSQADQQWSAWYKWERFGGSGTAAGFPILPVLGTAPPAVVPGIEARFRALAQKIKDHPNCNPSIEEALGIKGTITTPLDLSTVQPRLRTKISGGFVFIDWGWGGHGRELDMIRLEVDRTGGSNFGLLAIDTTPGYTDTMAFPGTPAKWSYRGMYFVDDQGVGLWSDTVSMTVG